MYGIPSQNLWIIGGVIHLLELKANLIKETATIERSTDTMKVIFSVPISLGINKSI